MADDSPAQHDTDRDLGAALHEVSNALTVVLGWLEAAEERIAAGQGGRTVQEAISVALAGARRGHRIARRAIGAQRVGAEEPAAVGPERVGDVVAECTRGLLHVAARAGAAIDVRLSQADAKAAVDSGERLLQVLMNLLLNAIAVTPSGGLVAVSSARTGASSDVVILVADGGPGIPPQDRARLFQRGASGRPGGAGIGLSHAQAVALEEGGRIALAPYLPGRGATFELHWPVSDVAPSTAPRTVRPAQLEGFRVVVMDDDAAVVELLETVLGARGATVTPARSLAALREVLAGAGADVALVDASPLGPDLEASLQSLKAGSPETDFVLISGAPDPGHAAERLGVTWLRKPFEIMEVIEVLRLVRASSRAGT